MKKLVIIPLMLLLAMTVTACDGDSPGTDLPDTEQPGNNGEDENSGNNNPENNSRMINIKVGDKTITAKMEDNVAARDFLSRLPLEVTLNDYASAEKIFYPSPALDISGAPRGFSNPQPGDITIYAPWGNIAIFYKNFSSNNSLIRIGHIEGSGIDALNVSGDVIVRFEQHAD
ncbi:MAG TPA: flavodoxin [Dysgonomonas sp.]|nr:flavodoxin [Dysgonomonas sp.]